MIRIIAQLWSVIYDFILLLDSLGITTPEKIQGKLDNIEKECRSFAED